MLPRTAAPALLINYESKDWMKIGKSRIGNLDVITLNGRLDAANEHAFEEEGIRLVLAGARCIAVDMAGLTYISSAGIGGLLRLRGALGETGGELFLCGAKGVVKSVLEITRVADMIKMHANLADAAVTVLPGTS